MQKTAIVLPCLNQGEFLAKVINDYLGYFQNDVEVIVVDNGSKDNTREITNSLIKLHPNVHLLAYDHALGKGAAVRAGFDYALERKLASYLGFTDPDGAIQPSEFNKLMKAFGKETDFVISSRWIPGANIVKKQTRVRILGGRFYNLLIRILFALPYRDTQCGAKVMTVASYQKIKDKLITKGFAFDLEMIVFALKNGLQITEVPITWNDQKGSTFSISKSSGRVAAETLSIWTRINTNS